MAEKRKDKGGTSIEYKARQAQKQTMNLVKTFIFVILLGVVVGFGIVYKDQLMAMLNKKEPATAAPAPKPAPPPVAKVEKPVDAPPPIAKPAAPMEKPKANVDSAPAVVRRGDDEVAKGIVAQGRELLEKFEFDKAAVVFKDGAQSNVSARGKADLVTWEKKAASFNLATKHIPVSEFAVADNAYSLETTDGREMVGLIKSDSGDMINFQMVLNPVSPGKTTLPLPTADIKKKTALSLKQRREQFLDLLGELESGIQKSRSTDYYDLVFISKRLGMGRECIEYLNRAYSGGQGHEADPYLADSFRKEVIRRTIDKCSLMLAGGRAKRFAEDELNKLLKTFPSYDVAQDEVDAFRMNILNKISSDFKSTITLKEAPKKAVAAAKKGQAPAQSAREIASDDQMEFVVENGGVQGKGAAAPIVDQANGKYEEGMKVYRTYRQGTNGANNKVLETAMHLLESAVDLYDKALKTDPANKAVMDRQTEANMIVYACKKYHTL